MPNRINPNWESLRKEFPALHQEVHGQPLVYLDNAATTHKPKAVIKAIQNFYERDNSNVHRGVHELSQRATIAFEGARERAAKFLKARSANEIIFTRGTTEGINLVARTWGAKNISRGEAILLTEMEHHSNIVPWQLLAEQTGAKLIYVPITGDDGLLDLKNIEELLQKNVRLFAFTHISNTLGTINPAAELCALAKKYKVTTLVDAPRAAAPASGMPLRARDIFRSTFRKSTATFLRSPATKCAARRASEFFTADRNCSKRCLPFTAAAT